MPNPTDEKRDAILLAAQVQFARYGFRRTSMEDIAEETGVSRASLYSYFDNKEEIFRSLSAKLHEQSLTDAERHLSGDSEAGEALPDRVAAALLERMVPFLEVVAQSAHGSEIYDENNRLCGDLVTASSDRFRHMLTTALSAAAKEGEIDLKSAGLTAPAAAELLHLGGTGLKHEAPDIASVKKRVHGFVRVFFAGLEA